MNNSIVIITLVFIMGINTQSSEINIFPQGIRLNNPGNIRHSHDKWNGETRLQTDKNFVRFLTPQAGIRAMMKTLLTYQNLHHLSSIERIVSRWAPSGENNTQAYIDDISIQMGVPPSYFIDLSNLDVLIFLTQAMVIHENGHPKDTMPPYWYEEKIYHNAAIDALDEENE